MNEENDKNQNLTEAFTANPQLEILKLTKEEFDRLPEYSLSLPTGKTVSKRWKRDITIEGGLTKWAIGEYVESDLPNFVGIRWYEPQIVVFKCSESQFCPHCRNCLECCGEDVCRLTGEKHSAQLNKTAENSDYELIGTESHLVDKVMEVDRLKAERSLLLETVVAAMKAFQIRHLMFEPDGDVNQLHRAMLAIGRAHIKYLDFLKANNLPVPYEIPPITQGETNNVS